MSFIVVVPIMGEVDVIEKTFHGSNIEQWFMGENI